MWKGCGLKVCEVTLQHYHTIMRMWHISTCTKMGHAKLSRYKATNCKRQCGTHLLVTVFDLRKGWERQIEGNCKLLNHCWNLCDVCCNTLSVKFVVISSNDAAAAAGLHLLAGPASPRLQQDVVKKVDDCSWPWLLACRLVHPWLEPVHPIMMPFTNTRLSDKEIILICWSDFHDRAYALWSWGCAHVLETCVHSSLHFH